MAAVASEPVVMNGNAGGFSLAPGDGRGTSSAGVDVAPAVNGHGKAAEVLVMDYSKDFPQLPEGMKADGDGADSKTAWAKPIPKLRSSNVSVVFHLPREERTSATLGDKLTREHEQCQRIAAETKTKIELSESKDFTLTVMLSGKRQDVEEARRRVVSALQQQAQREIVVPKEHHRWLVGRDGRRLKELEEDTDCHIQVPGRDVNSDIIRISGPREGIEKAAQKIILLTEAQAKLATENMIIEREFWPWLRGPSNERMNRMQESYGVRVNIPPPSANNSVVVISGPKEGVAAAVAEIKKIHADLKAKTKTVNISIPKAQHRYIIGPGGSGLADVLRQTGVSVEVPPEASDSNDIVLRGDVSAIQVAMPLVFAKATSVVTNEINCPSWLHRFIIGVKGEGIRAITGDTPKVQVDFDDSGKIVMQGAPTEVKGVKEQLDAVVARMIRDMDHTTVSVPAKHHRHIIGKAGSNVNKMKNDYDVQISIPDSTSNSTEIKIEGARDGVAKAAKEIRTIVERIENERSKDIIIEQRFHRQIIGQGGQAVAELRKKYPGVQLDFPEQGRKSDVVTLRGPKDQVDACAKHVTATVKTMKEESYQERVPIFKDFHRVIIGKGGANIRRIREETGCRIDMPDESSDNSAITVTGRKEAVQKACAQLQKIESELAAVETADVTIPHKLHSRMLGGGGRMIAEISNDCGGAHIKFPAAKENSDVVRIRGPKEEVERAKKLLLDLAKDRELSSHEDSLKFKPELRRFLIGRNGQTLRKVRDEFPDVRIMVPRDGDEDTETIHLIGKQEQVAPAKAALEKLIKTLNETVEATVDVDPAYHKHFVIRGALVLREIQDDCGGVMISFPKMATGEATVTIKGGKEGVEEAKRRILETVEDLRSTVTEYMEVNSEYHRNLLSRGGAHVNAIQKEHHVRINFPDRNLSGSEAGQTPSEAHGGMAPANAIALSGRPERIAEARKALAALVPITKQVAVPFDMHRALIGPKGADIRQFQMDHDVQLKIPAADERADIVFVTGTAEAVASAEEELTERVTRHAAESYEMSVDVPVEYHSRIIGPRGAQIEQYRKKYNVNVNVPKNVTPGEPAPITIRGLEENARAAAEDMKKLVSSLENMFRQECVIEPRIHSRIIGTRGKGLQQLEQQFKVEIRFPRAEDDRADLVIVSGETEDQVLDCVDELKVKEEEFMQDWVESSRYEAPKAAPKKPASKKQQIVMVNAPWDVSNERDFPTMADGPSPAHAPAATAWGRR